MAWLYAAPKRHKNDENPKSRIKTLDENHHANVLPETDPFLAKCFNLSGMYLSGGMGITPLTWVEISAFIQSSGYRLSGWEAEQVVMMSRVYCSFFQDAKDLGCAPPYFEGEIITRSIDEIRAKVAKQWESFSKDLKPESKKKHR